MTCNKMIVSLIVLTAPLFVSGCLELETVVVVDKDGSGTVEQTVYYPEMDLGGMSFGVEGEEAASFGIEEAEPTAEEKLAATRAQAEKAAAGMGEGVSLQSVEALPPKNGRTGVRIVYAFEDINKLRLDPMPEFTVGTEGIQIGNGGGAMGGDFAMADQFNEAPEPAAEPAPAPGEEADKIRFEFTAEPNPTLAIYTPEMTPPPGAEPVDDDPQAKAMAAMMMKQMFDGMLLDFRVRLNGRLTDTNATYASRKFNAVGLYRMDFDNLAKNQAALDKLLSMDATAEAETVKKQLQDPVLAEYLKLEMKERVDVSFE